jgi:hypothetical protein
VILLLSLPLGVALGLAAGGKLYGLGQLRLRGEFALVAVLLLQGMLPLVSAGGATRQVLYWAWALTFPVMAGVCMANCRVPGVALAGVGLAMNAAVILLNSGMPVLPEAVAAAGGAMTALKSTDFAHNVATAATRMLGLADIIPIPGPIGIRGVASAGDMLLAGGVATAIAAAMLKAPRGTSTVGAGSLTTAPK